jgi:hypothetical protein
MAIKFGLETDGFELDAKKSQHRHKQNQYKFDSTSSHLCFFFRINLGQLSLIHKSKQAIKQ